jgi:hypothetical protein
MEFGERAYAYLYLGSNVQSLSRFETLSSAFHFPLGIHT